MMLASVFFFSLMNVLVKILADALPVVEVTFFRSFFALIPVAGIIVAQDGWRASLRTERPLGHIWRGMVGITSMSAMFWSFHLLPLGDAVALTFAAPLFLTALSVPILGEKVGIHRWSAVLVGFVGVLIIVKPSGEVFQVGSLVALVAAAGQATAVMTVRQLSRTEPPNTIVFYFTLSTTVIIGTLVPFVWQTPTPTQWGLLTVMGVLGGCGQLFVTRAYSLAPAAAIAPLNYASLLFAVLSGWLLWGDVPSTSMSIGAAIVASSGLYILHRETRRHRSITSTQPPPGAGDD